MIPLAHLSDVLYPGPGLPGRRSWGTGCRAMGLVPNIMAGQI